MQDEIKALNKSIKILDKIAKLTMSTESREYMLKIWRLNLVIDNPSWKFIKYNIHTLEEDNQFAHVFSMVDSRMPKLGLLGYFGSTSVELGSKVLELASEKLREKGIKKVYGPIDGVLINNYRLSNHQDNLFAGEPVNPKYYIDCFKRAGFEVFNTYQTGKASIKFIKLYNLTVKLPKVTIQYKLREFNESDFLNELKQVSNLVNEIFPDESIYCTKYSFDEFMFLFKDKSSTFSSRYLLFLEHKNKPIGAVYAYPNGDTLYIKTIGVLKKYQGTGLYKILIKEIHKRAIDDGFKNVVYALVRKDNRVSKTRNPAVKIIRQYQTMLKEL